MPRVTPSTVVKIIDAEFPKASEDPPGEQRITLDPNTRSRLAGIVGVFEQIPVELLVTVGPDDYPRMLFVASELRETVVSARYPRPAGAPGGYDELRGRELYGGYNALSYLRRLLVKCRDQAPPEGSKLLKFLTPSDVRDSLLADLTSAERCLNNGDWKAATVLGGAIVEALLLWSLQQKPSDLSARLPSLNTKPKGGDPVSWYFYQLIEAAGVLTLIESDTVKACQLAKDSRNLIHAGAMIKNAFECDQGTAMAALAAAHSVTRDLAKRFP